MNAFLYGIGLQWKLDLRNRGVLLTYYAVPLVFFLFIGGIFTSINPESYKTLIQAMTVFGVSMGAFLGAPAPLIELYGGEMKKAYKVGGIPLWTAAAGNVISGLIHLMIMSALIYLIAPVAFHAVVPPCALTYFVTLAVFITACISIGTLLGLFVKSSSKLTMISQIIFLPSIMLSGIMFPADMLPEALQSVGKIFPATWGFASLCSSEWHTTGLLVLAGIIVAATFVSVWRIKKLKAD
jgi:ABC-2 type transport system permease protein